MSLSARYKEVQWQLDIAQDIQTNAPNWPLITVPTAAFFHTGTRTGTISTGVMLICYRVQGHAPPLRSSCPGNPSVSWMQQSPSFCCCCFSFVFNQHGDKLGHSHYSCRGWPCTLQQILNEIRANGSSFDACVKKMQWQWRRSVVSL